MPVYGAPVQQYVPPVTVAYSRYHQQQQQRYEPNGAFVTISSQTTEHITISPPPSYTVSSWNVAPSIISGSGKHWKPQGDLIHTVIAIFHSLPI